jgi:hypothetical protein
MNANIHWPGLTWNSAGAQAIGSKSSLGNILVRFPELSPWPLTELFTVVLAAPFPLSNETEVEESQEKN